MINLFKTFLYTFLLFLSFSCSAQVSVSETSVERILSVLSSDSLKGRKVFTPENEKAGDFIRSEFKQVGLEGWNGNLDYEDTFSHVSNGVRKRASNIVGVLPGKSKKDQYIIFSAHFDHIGVLQPFNDDSIANGADDDASGTTAVIELARFFSQKKDNEVTLIFIAFNGEEIGTVGSRNFATHIDPNKVIAMINIEMIGKESRFGKNAAFLTGFERSDLGKILQNNLKGSQFTLYPDPYPQFNLFYRSDNASLAKLGVPAHTFSTDQIDKDPYYHTVDDEVSTLSIKNITNTILGITQATASIVAGKEVPSRIRSK